MKNFNLMETTVAKIHEAYLNGSITCRELAEQYIRRIEAYNHKGPAINAIICINPRVYEEAEWFDNYVKEHHALCGPLHGIPTILKDNFETGGWETTSGAIALKGWIPEKDGFVVDKLRKAGALLLAKANQHEFAIWGETISSVLGQTLNPYDLTRTPGGSSGGTGAAVAANMGAIGMGTDTINSVRSPSSANSLVGIRPTLGLISRAGITPYSHNQDTAGPMCRTVEDAVKVLDVIKGYDPADEKTAWAFGNIKSSYMDYMDPNALTGKRIGIIETLFGKEKINDAVNRVIRKAMEIFENHGATLIPVELGFDQPYLNEQVSTHVDDFHTDLDAFLKTLPKDWPIHSMEEILQKKLFHPFSESNMRESMTKEVGSKDYLQKIYNKEIVATRVLKLMADNNLDAMIYPHQQQLVCKVGEHQLQRNGVLCSAIGFPSICVPAGFAEVEHAPIGIPVGMEIMGRPWSEDMLIGIAYAFEQHSQFRKTPVSTPDLDS